MMRGRVRYAGKVGQRSECFVCGVSRIQYHSGCAERTVFISPSGETIGRKVPACSGSANVPQAPQWTPRTGTEVWWRHLTEGTRERVTVVRVEPQGVVQVQFFDGMKRRTTVDRLEEVTP